MKGGKKDIKVRCHMGRSLNGSDARLWAKDYSPGLAWGIAPLLPVALGVANEPKPKTQNLTSSSRQTASPIRSRQVYTIGSPQFKFRFPELAPLNGIPNAHKRGLFRKLSSFIAGKEQPRPSGKPDSLEDLQTITYCDTDVLGEGAVRQLPLHFPPKS